MHLPVISLINNNPVVLVVVELTVLPPVPMCYVVTEIIMSNVDVVISFSD